MRERGREKKRMREREREKDEDEIAHPFFLDPSSLLRLPFSLLYPLSFFFLALSFSSSFASFSFFSVIKRLSFSIFMFISQTM